MKKRIIIAMTSMLIGFAMIVYPADILSIDADDLDIQEVFSLEESTEETGIVEEFDGENLFWDTDESEDAYLTDFIETEMEADSFVPELEATGEEVSIISMDSEEPLQQKRYNGMLYEVNTEEGFVSITGVEHDQHYKGEDCDYEDKCWIITANIPSELEGYPVTTIANAAFKDCFNMEKVILPDTITQIGSQAFADCTSLKEVTLPLSLMLLDCGAFQNCTSLTSINIPKNTDTHPYVTEQAYPGPFHGCASLETVSFEEGITAIPAGLFHRCNGLKKIEIPKTVTEIKHDAFLYCTNLTQVNLQEGLERIEGYAFDNCDALTEVELPSSLTFLGNGAFKDSDLLNTINIPANVQTEDLIASNTMYPGPFWGCSSLEKVTISDEMVTLPAGLFYRCNGLKKITIPDSVKSIGHDAFYKAENLGVVQLPNYLEEIHAYAFAECKTLFGVMLPDTLTLLEIGAFQNCCSLTDIYIPKKLSTPEATGTSKNLPGPFAGCSALTEVRFASEIKAIPYGLLYLCSGPTEIVIPEGVTTIHFNAFSRVPITKITIPASVETIEEDAFYAHENGLTIYGFSGSYAETYANENDILFISLGEWDGPDIEIEGGSVISAMTYLAMSDVAYRNKLQSYEGSGKSLQEEDNAFYELSKKKQSDGSYKPLPINNKHISPAAKLTWEHVYRQCLSTWQVYDVYDSPASGLWVVTFYRPLTGQMVIAFRGSEGLAWPWEKDKPGTVDWFVDNFEFGLYNEVSPQMEEAIKYVGDIIRDHPDLSISATGHSLGGGLAILVSNVFNIPAVPFDSAPTVDVGYYNLTNYMGNSFKGIDKWTYTDHLNQYCPVGNIESKHKNFIKHENLGPQEVDGQITQEVEKLRAFHDRYSIIDFEKDHFVLSKEVSSKAYSPSDTVIKDMSGIVGLISPAMADEVRPPYLILGSSSDNTLSGKRVLASFDVIYGGDGDDIINGLRGDDTLIGGSGADILDGNSGNDTYIIFKDQGIDTIYDYQGNDVLKLYGFSEGDDITIQGMADSPEFISVRCNGKTILLISKNRLVSLFNSFEVQKIDSKGNIASAVKIQDWNNWGKVNTYRISCPVNVEVLNEEGAIVTTLYDLQEDTKHTSFGNFYVLYDEETGEYDKYVDLADGYTLRIIGTGDGHMNISHIEDGDDGIYSCENIPVSPGEVFSVDISAHTVTDSNNIYSMKSNEEIKYTVNVTVSGDGKAYGGGAYTSGEYVDLSAEPSLISVFLGWYVNGTLVSEALKYRFCVEKDISIEARFLDDEPYLELNVIETIPLKAGQKTNKIKVTDLLYGDKVSSWTSSNPKIASVDNKGVITGRKVGSAVITVKTMRGAVANFTIKVQKKDVATTKITGLNKKITLKKGKKKTLKPILEPITSIQKVTYKSSKSSVAAVSKKGVITAKKPGKAKITVKAGKKSFKITVIVKK